VDFGFWGSLLGFWWAWIDLIRYLGCFLGVPGQNGFLVKKTKDLVFPGTVVTQMTYPLFSYTWGG